MCIAFLRSLLVVLTLSFIISSVMGSPIIIDTFNDSPGFPTDYPVHLGLFGSGFEEAVVDGLDPAETIFGRREVAALSLSTTGYGSTDLVIAGGKLGLGTNTVVSPYDSGWHLIWQNSDIFISVDLIDDDGTPNTGFLVDFISAEYDCEITFRVEGTLAHGGVGYSNPILVPANPNPHTVFVPFSQFVGDTIIRPMVDWGKVGAIHLGISGAEDGDYEIDAITVGVPEPASMLLLVSGAGLLLNRNRRVL